MTKPPPTWKNFERRVAGWFGGRRRGADFRNRERDGGRNDVIVEGWSIEVKLLSRPSYGEMLAAVKQAEAAKEKFYDIACAVVKRKRDLDSDSLVIFRRDEFLANFVSVKQEAE